MQQKNIAYLPAVPVRYGYRQPSMSRRGGVRLHPVADGSLNMESSQQYLRTRDFTGQKLRDHVHPLTGMFTHCTSLIESAPLNPAGTAPEDMRSGVSGTDNASTRLLPKKVIDTESGRVYLDEAGRVIRTTSMGEAPVIARPTKSGPDNVTRSPKRRRNVRSRAPKPATSGGARVPGASGTNGRITDADVEAYIRAVAAQHGRQVTVITPNMMRDGREALKILRRQAERALAGRADDRAVLVKAAASIKQGGRS